MRALHRRWKLAVAIAVAVCGAAVFSLSLIAALAAGLLAGVVAALLLEAQDRTIKTAADVHRMLGLEVVANLPRCAGFADGAETTVTSGLLAGLSPDDPATRALRVLRDRLEAACSGTSRRVVMMTSCIPGEGKSTVSANLAAILGQAGAKVLLVGCDLRRPTLGKRFGQPEEPGLAELLAFGDQAALRRLTDPPIDFIPGGGTPQNPAELLDSVQMTNFLEFARERYDYVILDAPPVLAVTDAQLLAQFCDFKLAVIEPCRTRFAMVRQLIESLQAVGERIDGVVFNDKSGLAAKYYGADREPGRGGDREKRSKAVAGISLPGKQAGVWSRRVAAAVVLAALLVGGFSWLEWHDSDDDVGSGLPMAAGTRATTRQTANVAENAPATITAGRREDLIATGERMPEGTAPVTALTASRPLLEPVGRPMPPAVAPAPRIPARPLAAADPGPEVSRATDPAHVAVSEAELSTRTVPGDGLQTALTALAGAWQKPVAASGFSIKDDPHGWFAAMGLTGSPLSDDLAALLQLNTPLLLESRPEEAGTAWLAIVGRRGFKWLVSPPTNRGELLSESELKQLWTGRGYLPWQDPLHLAEIDAVAGDPGRVAKLQHLLAKSGVMQPFDSGVYDRETIKAIGHLQAGLGLRVNGRITPETLVVLYQADPAFLSPKFPLWP